MTLTLSIVALVLAGIPAAMLMINLRQFRVLASKPERGDEAGEIRVPSVSVLIPARDEQDGIGACLESVLASEGVHVEAIVLDDDSSDATPEIVADYCARDQRVRLIRGQPLPTLWNGKQHACKQLADAAEHDRFAFIDADVRLTPDALVRLIDYQDATAVGLLSAFPHQTTRTWLERWLIPMMHFILLGYLPFARMRTQSDASLAAGCGQLFLTTRDDYYKAGTHEAIKQSRHDGVKLPRAYRAAGIMTDVVDGTDIADCRMYRGAKEVVRGVLKNATEGIANPKLIGIFSVLLLGCSLLPVVALVLSLRNQDGIAIVISAAALILAHVPRLVAAATLRQSWIGALCHVPATTGFVVLQWVALANKIAGRQVAWRGRMEL